jgi:hypothetical protein
MQTLETSSTEYQRFAEQCDRLAQQAEMERHRKMLERMAEAWRALAEEEQSQQDVALYLDDKDAVKWWWRIAARRDWSLQGWMKTKIYPDFLVHLDTERDVARLLVLETKGKHLEGSADTQYKSKFFELLEAAYTQGKDAGQVELFPDRPDAMRFRILIQDDPWQPNLENALSFRPRPSPDRPNPPFDVTANWGLPERGQDKPRNTQT